MGSIAGWLLWLIVLVVPYLLFLKCLKIRSLFFRLALSLLVAPILIFVLGTSVIPKIQWLNMQFSLGDAYIGMYLSQCCLILSGVFGVIYIATLFTRSTQIKLTQQDVSNSKPHLSRVSLELWMAYFGLMLVSLPFGLFKEISALSSFQFIPALIVIVGLWGYLREQPFIRQNFWKSFFWVYTANLIVIILWMIFQGWQEVIQGTTSTLMIALITLVITVFSIPQLLALWRYGYCCHHIWEPISTITNTSDITSVTNSGK